MNKTALTTAAAIALSAVAAQAEDALIRPNLGEGRLLNQQDNRLLLNQDGAKTVRLPNGRTVSVREGQVIKLNDQRSLTMRSGRVVILQNQENRRGLLLLNIAPEMGIVVM